MKRISYRAVKAMTQKTFLSGLFWKWKRRRMNLKNFISVLLGKRSCVLMSEFDFYRLYKVIREERKMGRAKEAKLRKLKCVLKKTNILPVRLVPPDIITMNSRFKIVNNKGKMMELCLVYPKDADKKTGKISVLSWLGMCLIGRKKGDNIRNRFHVDEILYQPEAKNEFHL
jgi:regulator of nucleoside diphosphate kinase